MMEYIYYALGLGIAGAIVYITLALPIDTKAKIKLILATVTGTIAFIGYRKVKSWRDKAKGYDELESRLRYAEEQARIDAERAQKEHQENIKIREQLHKSQMALEQSKAKPENKEFLETSLPDDFKVGLDD